MSLLTRIKKLELIARENFEDKNAWRSDEDGFWAAAGISEEQLKQCKTEDEAWDLIPVEWDEDEIGQKENDNQKKRRT